MSSDSVAIGDANYPDLVDGVHISDAPLTKTQAEELTRSIRDAAEVIWVLIARAHAGKAWKALGYDSWADYVQQEFNMSRSRSYQLLDQAKVIAAVSEAVPAGTDIAVTESSARELKYVIQEAVPEIREKTKGLEPEEAVKVTQEILAKYKNQQAATVQEEPVGEGDVEVSPANTEQEMTLEAPKVSNALGPLKPEIIENDDNSAPFADFEDQSTTLHPAAPSPQVPAPPAIDPEELARIRKNVNAAHDIYSALAALSSLPDNLEEVIDIIPKERGIIINKNMPTARENLERFSKKWLEANSQDDSESN